MHVVLPPLASGPRRRREQGPYVEVETQVGEGRRDHFLAAVVAVLADLGDEQTRAAALGGFESLHRDAHPFDGAGHTDLPLVDARDGLDLRAMPSIHLLQRGGYLADGRLGARRIDREREQIA